MTELQYIYHGVAYNEKMTELVLEIFLFAQFYVFSIILRVEF